MNELQILRYNEKSVRTIEKGGETWWVLRDVCEILDLTNPSMIAERLDEDEKAKIDPKQYLGSHSNEPVTIISESGLYNTILLSRKPEAKRFKRWVTHEVLPSIHKHGMFARDDLLDNPDLLIEVATALKQERQQRKQLETKNSVLEQIISEYEPKIQYLDTILQSTGTLATSQIAADYGLSAQELNKILHQEGIQHRVGDQWILYKKHMGLGYTKSETIRFVHTDGKSDSRLNTKWTQKGRLMIHSLLEQRGIWANADKENFRIA